MKLDPERVLAQPAGGVHPGWRSALPALAGAIALILALYWQTAFSMGLIWWRSETFAHGFLIVPIALWLVWLKRRDLARLAPTRDALGLAFLAGAAALWLAGAAGHVSVVQQYAMMLMIPATVLALAGRRVALAAAFPLAFLLLGVPVGEALIPPLMNWTADFTVAALQLSGIPVYREGLYFTIPSGNWSVVEGCSGLRYLIASLTVGVLFAYLNYRRWWKRALFVAAALAVPILANGLRAYGIVMIAHLSDMKLAMGVDHFIYGWVFFGLVMVLLFWIGSFWRDEAAEPGSAALRSGAAPALSRMSLAAGLVLVLGVAASAPLYAAFMDREIGAGRPLPAVAVANGWSRVSEPLTAWEPRYDPAASTFSETYRKGDSRVGLQLRYYHGQRPGAQLVTSTNVMVVQKHPVWSNVGERRRAEPFALRETRLRSAGQRLLTWDWFWISGEHLASPYLAKAYFARDRLLGRGDDGAAIILAAPYEERAEAAEALLREFARDMLPSIEAALLAAGQPR